MRRAPAVMTRKHRLQYICNVVQPLCCSEWQSPEWALGIYFLVITANWSNFNMLGNMMKTWTVSTTQWAFAVTCDKLCSCDSWFQNTDKALDLKIWWTRLKQTEFSLLNGKLLREKWDWNSRLEERLQPECSAFDRSAILTRDALFCLIGKKKILTSKLNYKRCIWSLKSAFWESQASLNSLNLPEIKLKLINTHWTSAAWWWIWYLV